MTSLQGLSPLRNAIALVVVAVAFTMPTGAQSTPVVCNGNDTPNNGQTLPCFGNVPDILNGKTTLLPNDDLIVNTNFFDPTTQTFYPAGGNLWTASSAIVKQSSTSITNKNFQVFSNQITIRGRLWAVGHDQILSASVNIDQGGTQAFTSSLEDMDAWISPPSLPSFNKSQNLYGVSGDFLGNGYDQMVVLGVQPGNPGQLVLQALAAADPIVESDGISAGTALPISTSSTVFAVTAGIFSQPSGNATGPALQQAQVAVVSTSPNNNQGLIVTFYQVNQDLSISTIGSPYTVPVESGTPPTPHTIAAAAGRFNGGNHDQLAIAYPIYPETPILGTVEVTTVDFNAQGAPSSAMSSATSFQITPKIPASGYAAALYLAKGAFNWSSGIEQLAISLGTDGISAAYIGVMSFNSSLSGTLGTPVTYGNSCHFGLAAGNYDSDTFNLQLADTATNCKGNGVFNANIYNVDPSTFAVTLENTTGLGAIANQSGPPSGAGNLAVSLIAGDEEGRSLLLGPPEKLTVISHHQPDFVLEVPPMHVDWALPITGSMGITNITVFPNTFNTSIAYSTNSTSNLMQQTKTSYTWATKETASESASYGFAGDSLTVAAKQAAAQLHDSTVSKNYDTNAGVSTTYNTTTTLDDIEASTTANLNVYTYPVLGQCDNGAADNGVCPSGGSPLYVQYSGQDNVTYTQNQPGASDEYYQPVHEPGNVLSYPASYTMLSTIVGDAGLPIANVSSTKNLWDPVSTSSTTTTWSGTNTSDSTVGSTSSHSFDTSVSASGSVSFDGFGASASVGFDYNQSNSLSTLNQSVNSLSSSTGVLQKFGIGASLAPAYDYTGNTVVYGQANNNVQQTELSPGTALQKQGYLVVGQMADILENQSGSQWWKQTYTGMADIALNHPARWSQRTPQGVNPQLVWENCPYGYSAGNPPGPDTVDCAPVTPTHTPVAGYADLPYYTMKGLFITPGGTSNGPQTNFVPQGGSLNLRARVYNYSLVNYKPADQLQVEFYAQPYNATTGTFIDDPVGSGQFAQAVFLGVGSTQDGTGNAPPPAYCGGSAGATDPCLNSTTLNFKDVYLTWDTNSNPAFTANTYWEIWVVVWVFNGDTGQVETEPLGHGFTRPPANATQFHDPSQVPIELYSNNLGIYNGIISVVPATLSASTTPAVSAAARRVVSTAVAKKLTLGKLSISGTGPILRSQPTTILAPHLVTGDHVDQIYTEYFDGDPENGGSVFDTQHVPHVIGGLQYLDRAVFIPRTCGEHEIFVRATPMDGTAMTATAKAKFKVTADPVGAIDQLITFVKSPHYPKGSRPAMLLALDTAKRAFNHDRTQEGGIAMQLLLKFVEDGGFDLPKDVRQPFADSIKDLLGCL